MKKWFKIVRKVILLCLPGLFALGLGWMLRTETEFFIVRDLPVDIESQMDQKALVKTLKPDFEKQVGAMKGMNIWKLGLESIQRNLLANPWVESVEVSRRFPNRIATHIRLKEIPFVLVTSKNKFFPISQKGEKLPGVAANVVPTVPLLRNNNILEDKQKLSTLIELYSEVPAIGPLKKENIAELDFNTVSGLQLKLIEEDVDVHLGAVNIQTKALQALRVLDYLKSQKHKARVIDASFTKKVLVRPRKGS